MTRVRLAVTFVAVLALISAVGAQVAPQSPTAPDDFLKGVYLATTTDLVAPTLVKQVHPKYTPDAMRAKLQGQVHVQAVVMPDGTVGRARVIDSLDKIHGLDQAALAAVTMWMFEPGTLKGQAVPVAIDLYLDFRLH